MGFYFSFFFLQRELTKPLEVVLPSLCFCNISVEVSELTVDGADLVAHGVADQMVVGIKHHEDLVHAELLGGRCHPGGFVVWAALEGDGLTPLVASGLDSAVRGGDGVVTVGGGSDHWKEGSRKKSEYLSAADSHCTTFFSCSWSLSLQFLSYW